MNELTLFIALAALLIMVTGLVYLSVQRSILTEPLIAMLCGIALGPHALGWFHPKAWEVSEMTLMNHFSKYTLAMALMATALRLPGRYPGQSAKFQIPLIVLGTTLMSLFSAGVFYLLLGSSALLCLLLGTIVAPTDPVLATTIVSGKVAEKNIPERLRHLISGESGANDGFAFPCVMLPLLLISSAEGAWSEWTWRVVLYENAFAVLLAVGIGFLARVAVKRATGAGLMTSKSLLSYSIALGFGTLSLLELMKCNGIIGVFAAGLAFNYHMSEEPEAREERVQEMIERIFLVPIFLFFGIVIPWAEIVGLGWKAWLIPLAILLLRRLPAIALLKPMIRPLHDGRDTGFVGWFGPIGVAALYYATHAHEKLHEPLVWSVPSLVIFASVVAHAVTSYPFARAYAAKS